MQPSPSNFQFYRELSAANAALFSSCDVIKSAINTAIIRSRGMVADRPQITFLPKFLEENCRATVQLILVSDS